MTLQEAIRIIAVYDGWSVLIDPPHSPRFDKKDKTSVYGWNGIGYQTSADALLPVFSSVKIKIAKRNLDTNEYWEKVNRFERLIINMNYEQACIELAEIIEQLNEKK
jgi:hypothetical protein